MRLKNYPSAIHNFAHSLQSIDYRISGSLIFNVIVDIFNQGLEPLVVMDFIKKETRPSTAVNKESQRVMSDYLNWLPEHLKNHKCDFELLEELKVTIQVDFNNPEHKMTKSKNLKIKIDSEVGWKICDRPPDSKRITEYLWIKKVNFGKRFPTF